MALSLLAANNAQTVLAAGISSTATSLTVNAGTGTLFPSPVAGTSFFKLTIIDAATGSLTEIVHVTARNGDVFTIQRGQEGTVPRSWSANDIVANMMTAGTLSYILGSFQPLDPTLTALAALVGVANKLPYFNGDDTAALTDLTQVGRDIIGKTDIAAVLQYLGLGASAFGLKNFVVFSTAGVSTWTVPDELKSGRKAKVTVIGAGGSGGRSSSGGGGGGGGKAVKLVDLTGIESVPITVGAGGVKPAAGSTSIPGNSGGSSSFGTFCSATGGGGGGNVSGGSSGIGVNGDINTGTGPGNPGAYHSSGSYVSGSGGGAGGPGSLSSSDSDGFDAIGPGGGGSGAATGSTTVSCRPGAGYSGMVLIEW